MKAVGVGFVAGLLGVMIGSLAAQAPVRPDVSEAGGDAIYEGPVEAISLVDGNQPPPGDTVRVYEDWVLLVESRQLIPRDRIAVIITQDDTRRGGRDFGDDPQGERPARPDRFRED